MSAVKIRTVRSRSRDTLEVLLSESFGSAAFPGPLATEATRVERRPAAYRSSAHLEEVDVRLADGTVVPLMFKAFGVEFSGTGVPVRPDFMRDATREALLYRRVLGPESVAAPHLYAALCDPGKEWACILVERIEGRALWQCGELDLWCDVASWLGGHQARFATDSASLEDVPLIRMDRAFHRVWLERARDFAGRGSVPRVRRALACLDRFYEHVLDRLDECPQAFVHGDLFPSNVLIRDDEATSAPLSTGSGRRPRSSESPVCVIDWESAGLGPCLMDLASLTSGSWSAQERVEMECAYREALTLGGGWSPSAAHFERLLAAARVQLAVIQLGWSPGWAPPAHHRHDWVSVIEEYVGGGGV